MRTRASTRPATILLAVAAAAGAPALAQTNAAAIRFFGTGSGQQDRVRIQVAEVTPPAFTTALNVGAGSFTIEFCIRGTLADNPAPASPGPGGQTYADLRWIEGHTVVDRDIWGTASDCGERDFGVSVVGGRVRFGTGRGAAFADGETTLEGVSNVLTGQWRHVAVVRDRAAGRLSIYVDGQLDAQSPVGRSTADLSYPTGLPAGCPQNTPWGPYFVLGAEKHDAGVAYPSFAGFFDEFRVWSLARTPAQIAATFRTTIAPTCAGTLAGLVGNYRLEEGSGTAAGDSSPAASPTGQVIAGVAGNAEWRTAAADPSSVAPVFFRSDWTRDGVRAPGDIFAFLNAYFARDPSADFDQDGARSPSDLFAFLTAYFAGC